MKNNLKIISIIISFLVLIMTLSCDKNPPKVIPTLSTTVISSIKSTSATSGGNITRDGGSSVSSRGVCWSINQNPTTSDNKTSDGSGIGSFTSSITGLSPGENYYVRAYATNSNGTAYGNQLTLSSLAILPTITTIPITTITSTSATSGGNISSDGGSAVTSRGVCWSTNLNPKISDKITSDGTGIGNFSSILTGLSENTIYYVRSYATNAIGTSYGDEMSFVTQVYYPGTSLPSIKIGYTWWAPVNVGYDRNHVYGLLFQWGRKYGQGYNTSETPGLTNASGPVGIDVGNNPSYSHMFFTSSSDWCSPQASSWDMILYNPCPTGWRIPTSEEFKQLFNTGNIWTTSGGPDNLPGRWFGPDYATGGTNKIFLPAAGIRFLIGSIGDVDSKGRYWTVTPNSNLAFHLYFDSGFYSNGIASNGVRGTGISLRCVKN